MDKSRRLVIAQEIVKDIEGSIKRLVEKPTHVVAGYIVGATWANEVDIMDFESEYPELINVADLASDIEILDEDDEYRRELWRRLLINFDILKEKVAKEAERNK